MAVAAQKIRPSNLGDVGMPSYYPPASGESWARVGFADQRWQPQEVEGWHGKPSPPAGAAAAAAPAAARSELGAAFGFAGGIGGSIGNEQHPRGTGVRLGFGPGAGSVGSTAGTIFSNSIRSIGSSNSNSVGPVFAGDAAAVTAAPWAPAGQDGNGRCQQQQPRDWTTPAQRLSSMPSAQTSTVAPGPAGVGGLGLLHASELRGAEASGPFAVDELLWEPFLEGFGEGGSEEDMLRYFGGNVGK